MVCLFTNKKSNPKELFEALQEIIKNRENNLNNNKNISNDVKNLYGELKISAEERFKLCDDNLDEDLREIMRDIIQKAIEELVDLWDKCLIRQCERDEFFESLQKIESVDEVYELLSQVSRLQELYVKCAANGCWKDVP
ncbi:hypothetical protein Glove_71g69 [Diversispora epigaea]|uniref:Uncharacterized protein n=1 Tax=Diversispora epigaea TaxID=1348612 RepID=A0A397JKW5_9GLOM|nr:hypothetical protein Glove_71g69 [Diversispora epigaea]